MQEGGRRGRTDAGRCNWISIVFSFGTMQGKMVSVGAGGRAGGER